MLNIELEHNGKKTTFDFESELDPSRASEIAGFLTGLLERGVSFSPPNWDLNRNQPAFKVKTKVPGKINYDIWIISSQPLLENYLPGALSELTDKKFMAPEFAPNMKPGTMVSVHSAPTIEAALAAMWRKVMPGPNLPQVLMPQQVEKPVRRTSTTQRDTGLEDMLKNPGGDLLHTWRGGSHSGLLDIETRGRKISTVTTAGPRYWNTASPQDAAKKDEKDESDKPKEVDLSPATSTEQLPAVEDSKKLFRTKQAHSLLKLEEEKQQSVRFQFPGFGFKKPSSGSSKEIPSVNKEIPRPARKQSPRKEDQPEGQSKNGRRPSKRT